MVMIYTTAPKAYDGFSTTEVASEIKYQTKDGKSIRQVEIEPRDLDWQVSRYGSGMHLAVMRPALEELLGWFVEEVES